MRQLRQVDLAKTGGFGQQFPKSMKPYHSCFCNSSDWLKCGMAIQLWPRRPEKSQRLREFLKKLSFTEKNKDA